MYRKVITSRKSFSTRLALKRLHSTVFPLVPRELIAACERPTTGFVRAFVRLFPCMKAHVRFQMRTFRVTLATSFHGANVDIFPLIPRLIICSARITSRRSNRRLAPFNYNLLWATCCDGGGHVPEGFPDKRGDAACFRGDSGNCLHNARALHGGLIPPVGYGLGPPTLDSNNRHPRTRGGSFGDRRGSVSRVARP